MMFILTVPLLQLTSGNVSATDIASSLKNNTQEQNLSPHDLDTLVEIISNLTILIDDQVTYKAMFRMISIYLSYI